jgi:hypothetical protein
MARRLWCKAGLAAVMMVSFCASAHAQGLQAFCPPQIPSGYGPLAPSLQPGPIVGGADGGANCNGGTASGTKHPLLNTLTSGPILSALRDHPQIGCWTHPNMFGCGSLRGDLLFTFGSCRAFFGQQCLKGPPQDAVAPMLEGTPNAAPPPRARLPFSFCPSCR